MSDNINEEITICAWAPHCGKPAAFVVRWLQYTREDATGYRYYNDPDRLGPEVLACSDCHHHAVKMAKGEYFKLTSWALVPE